MSEPVLRCADVTITYANGHCALRDLNLTIAPGECLALVGESGCGKTTLARAVSGLLPPGTSLDGSIRLCGTEINGASAETLRKLRGLSAGFVTQEPFSAYHPLNRVYDHLAEAWRVHALMPSSDHITGAVEALGITEAALRLRQYPHEWSGGMLQRATIVAAATHHPPLLIADEPTSALDADHAQAVLSLLRSPGAALLLISHDLQLVADYADRIAVCYQGRLVETGTADEILRRPAHSYTKTLLEATQFQPACQRSMRVAANEVVLEARSLGKSYSHPVRPVHAVSKVDLSVRRGEIVGIQGPSGCGKSTLLRMLATIETPDTGSVLLGDEIATAAGMKRLPSRRARSGFVMPIFQEPVSSLDRRWPTWRTLTEPLLAGKRTGRPGRSERQMIAREFLPRVGLAEIDSDARPDELSVGQCQRLALGRALIARPAVIVADEPTSALDAVTAASVLRLLAESAAAGTAIVIVSHDARLLHALCHRVLQMKDGLIEEGN